MQSQDSPALSGGPVPVVIHLLIIGPSSFPLQYSFVKTSRVRNLCKVSRHHWNMFYCIYLRRYIASDAKTAAPREPQHCYQAEFSQFHFLLTNNNIKLLVSFIRKLIKSVFFGIGVFGSGEPWRGEAWWDEACHFPLRNMSASRTLFALVDLCWGQCRYKKCFRYLLSKRGHIN